jgi:hypothetical protein
MAWVGAVGVGATVPRILTYSWFLPVLIALLFLPALAFAIRKRPFDAAGVWWTAGTAILVEAVFLSR